MERASRTKFASEILTIYPPVTGEWSFYQLNEIYPVELLCRNLVEYIQYYYLTRLSL